MNFLEFEVWRKAHLAAQPHLMDGGCTTFYKHLAEMDPVRFGPIASSINPKAIYRCHVAEEFLRHMHLDESTYKPRTLITHGVRASLQAIFQHWAKEDRLVFLPKDVYPVYLELAQQAQLRVQMYAQSKDLPWGMLEKSFQPWGLLVCTPLKPWGGRIDSQQLERLMCLAENKGQVILDGAYQLQPDPWVEQALNQEKPLAFLGSLSKGWLSPWKAGIVIGPRTWIDDWRSAFQQLPKNTESFAQAFAALTEYAHRPQDVLNFVDQKRTMVVDYFKEKGIPVIGSEGYFLTTSESIENLLEQNILAIPPSVFGSGNPNIKAVVSVLALEIP